MPGKFICFLLVSIFANFKCIPRESHRQECGIYIEFTISRRYCFEREYFIDKKTVASNDIH